jgi:hypothetical protein
MKNAEGAAHPFELLDRRLKESTDQLRDAREALEQLGRSAGTLQRMFGVEEIREAARAAGRAPKGQSAAPPAPTRGTRPTHANQPSASAAKDDIPEWRKVFPDLSSKVPGRGK